VRASSRSRARREVERGARQLPQACGVTSLGVRILPGGTEHLDRGARTGDPLDEVGVRAHRDGDRDPTFVGRGPRCRAAAIRPALRRARARPRLVHLCSPGCDDNTAYYLESRRVALGGAYCHPWRLHPGTSCTLRGFSRSGYNVLIMPEAHALGEQELRDARRAGSLAIEQVERPSGSAR